MRHSHLPGSGIRALPPSQVEGPKENDSEHERRNGSDNATYDSAHI